jgi:hypothetical protein
MGKDKTASVGNFRNQPTLMETAEAVKRVGNFKSESRKEMNRIVHSILEKANSLHPGTPLHVEKVVYQYAEPMEMRNASGKAHLKTWFSTAPFRRPVISVDLSWVKSNIPESLDTLTSLDMK